MAMHSIDLKEVEGELTRSKANVDAWAKQRTEFAIYTRDSHLESMQDQSGVALHLRVVRSA